MIRAFWDRFGRTLDTFDPTPCFPLRCAQNMLDATQTERLLELAKDEPGVTFNFRETRAFRDRIFPIVSTLRYHGGVLCDLSGFYEDSA